MKKLFLSALLLSFLFSTFASEGVIEFLKPYRIESVADNSMSLNGTWQFQYEPNGKWMSIAVPGEAAMQGFALEHDKAYTYRRTVAVPADFKGKRVLLRFDGVYSYARLYVNGKYVRDHHGGFTRWEADVTDLIKSGAKNEIQLEVTDRHDDISYASGYAHHTIGGILRDVTLYAVNANAAITNLAIETHLDSVYRDATLRLKYDARVSGGPAELKAVLRDGETVVAERRFDLQDGNLQNDLLIENPIKWDAEHPHLYTLDLTLSQHDQPVAYYRKNVGFRKIEIRGNRMFVNGNPVKLRGSCRHDVHPTLGRTTDAYLDSMDVVLLKRSNQNYVRTSHYPPTDRFVEFCDRMGVYVECETAICFVNTHAQKNYEQSRRSMHEDPEYTERILGQLKEMVATHRNSPSVLFWSIGNESTYGANFQLSYDWIKAEDTTRPTIFSYPGSVPAGVECYDIASMHYQDVSGNLNQWGVRSHGYQVDGMPAVFDEWAHVPCYTYSTLRDDPNIREFWGQSLDRMWSGLFGASGGLGGAIWGYIDETFMIPQPKKGMPFWIEYSRTSKPIEFTGKAVGYGEWGIIDVWRREKPEFWGTKKAYSPVRLETKAVTEFLSGMPLFLQVYNRFDHTSLDEIRAKGRYDGIEFDIPLAAIVPHQKGILKVPAQDWESGKELIVEFFDQAGELIDGYGVRIGQRTKDIRQSDQSDLPLRIQEKGDWVTVEGDGFKIPFNKTTGLIENATSNGTVVISRGPALYVDVNYNHLTGAEVRGKAHNFVLDDNRWTKKDFQIEKIGDQVRCTVNGSYDGIELQLVLTISPNGQTDIYYQAEGEPNGYLREVGLKFVLPENFQSLEWSREGYWSYYPENHFAENRGVAPLYNTHVPKYGADPAQEWQSDTHNYYYWADQGAPCEKPLTQWAKGMKENIYEYTLKGKKGELSVVSDDASVACRLNKTDNGQMTLFVNNRWDYPEIAWGGYCRAMPLHPTYGVVSFRLK